MIKTRQQDHAAKFGQFVVRMKTHRGWDRNLDGMGGRYKTLDEAEAKAHELCLLVGAPTRVDKEDDGR